MRFYHSPTCEGWPRPLLLFDDLSLNTLNSLSLDNLLILILIKLRLPPTWRRKCIPCPIIINVIILKTVCILHAVHHIHGVHRGVILNFNYGVLFANRSPLIQNITTFAGKIELMKALLNLIKHDLVFVLNVRCGWPLPFVFLALLRENFISNLTHIGLLQILPGRVFWKVVVGPRVWSQITFSNL